MIIDPAICSWIHSKMSSETSVSDPCSVCLQKPVHPTILPCSHIFCFLCAKGAILQTERCPLCRHEVPVSYLFDPKFVETEMTIDSSLFNGTHSWHYEGKKNGWWLYDPQASAEIERHYQRREKKFEMLIAGFIFVINFEDMIQYRKETPHKIRKIKRDISNNDIIKGVAGVKSNHFISNNSSSIIS